MFLQVIYFTTITATFVCAQGPVVTLKHGGQLEGKSMNATDGELVDLFLGIRYVKAPTGDLRFKKPENVSSWSGIKKATTSGSPCLQTEWTVIGDEDCLFLNIAVPGGVERANKKPVMVWIHGGGYRSGSSSDYNPVPLALTGDVIVVTINYRLGMLGFLYDGPGTGNFGLWDQRAAIVWVKENIEQFGGDPDLITIFGESAGAGSVSSQTMGQHNDGLFKRAVQQSGSLFQSFSWFLTNDFYIDLIKSIRTEAKCKSSEELYDCLRDMTFLELLALNEDQAQLPWHPLPDGDFFNDTISSTHSYALSKRFDLMAGFNGQEGGLGWALTVVPSLSDPDNGISLDKVTESLQYRCLFEISPLSVDHCVEFIITNYQLNSTADNRERARRFIEFLGDFGFNVDIINQLQQHSASTSTKTYAYYFDVLYNSSINPWSIPEWAKVSADHAVDIEFFFGDMTGLTDTQEWRDIFPVRATNANSKHTTLSLNMMKMWTNFAKTGNPNTPNAPSSEIPEWPEFNTDSSQFIQFNVSGSQIVTTPNGERAEKIQSVLLTARKELLDGGVLERVPGDNNDDDQDDQDDKDKVGDDKDGAMEKLPTISLLLFACLLKMTI